MKWKIKMWICLLMVIILVQPIYATPAPEKAADEFGTPLNYDGVLPLYSKLGDGKGRDVSGTEKASIKYTNDNEPDGGWWAQDYNSFLGETKNLRRMETIKLEFHDESDLHLFKSGYHDVEIWDKETYMEYQYSANRYADMLNYDMIFYAMVDGKLGIMNNNNDGSYFYGEQNNRPLDREISKKTSQTLWFGEDVQGKLTANFDAEFTVYGSDEVFRATDDGVYGVVVFNYVPNEKFRFVTPENIQDFMHVKFIKIVDDGMVGQTMSAENMNTTQAVQTSVPFEVDSKAVKMNAYNINGYNYIKLKDFAAVMNGSCKQFDIQWDAVNGCILLETRKPYVKVGGELTIDNAKYKEAKVSTLPVKKDGVELSVESYVMDGEVYFRLRDLGKYFDTRITFNPFDEIIMMITSLNYEEEEPINNKSIDTLFENQKEIVDTKNDNGEKIINPNTPYGPMKADGKVYYAALPFRESISEEGKDYMEYHRERKGIFREGVTYVRLTGERILLKEGENTGVPGEGQGVAPWLGMYIDAHKAVFTEASAGGFDSGRVGSPYTIDEFGEGHFQSEWNEIIQSELTKAHAYTKKIKAKGGTFKDGDTFGRWLKWSNPFAWTVTERF